MRDEHKDKIKDRGRRSYVKKSRDGNHDRRHSLKLNRFNQK